MTTIAVSENDRSLPALVSKFHMVLSTAWPRPGVAQMAGASVFIATTLFTTLKDGMREIQDALELAENSGVRNQVAGFWAEFSKLFSAVSSHNTQEDRSEQIDNALNILYLASGVLYRRIVEISGHAVVQDERIIGVEELDDLLALCHWTAPDTTLHSVFYGLLSSMAFLTEKIGRSSSGLAGAIE